MVDGELAPRQSYRVLSIRLWNPNKMAKTWKIVRKWKKWEFFRAQPELFTTFTRFWKDVTITVAKDFNTVSIIGFLDVLTKLCCFSLWLKEKLTCWSPFVKHSRYFPQDLQFWNRYFKENSKGLNLLGHK